MNTANPNPNPKPDPKMSFENTSLPISQLESLKFKANQIIESIQALQRTIEAGNQNAMPAWPDVLSKYNILLSQTHSFSTSLITPIQHYTHANGAVSRVNAQQQGNSYEKIALHPSTGMTDTQLDNDVIPLLRNQQTTDVLRMENETVRRLSEHMVTRGSVGVLGGMPAPSLAQQQQQQLIAPTMFGGNYGAQQKKPEYEDVLKECEQIRGEHDRRVERAVRAVMMLKEKFDWKQRVEVEVEEPEELDWDPRVGVSARGAGGEGGGNGVEDGDVGMDSPGEGGSSDENDEVEGELVDDSMGVGTPASTPGAPGEDSVMGP